MSRNTYLYRLFFDTIIVVISFFLAKLICYYFNLYSPEKNLFIIIYIIVFWYFSAQVSNLYNQFLSRSISQEIFTVIKTIILQFVFLVFAFFFLSNKPLNAKWFTLFFFILEILLLPVVKYFSRWYFSRVIKKRNQLINIVIVGGGDIGNNFYNYIVNNIQLGYRVEGFVDEAETENLYLGNIGKLDTILKSTNINEVVIALSNTQEEMIQSVIKIAQSNGKRVKLIPDFFIYSTSFTFNNIGSFPIIFLNSIPLDNIELRFFKRIFDIVFSLFILLLFFTWLIPIIALLIKITSKGSIFFVQERWGLNNQKILCYKFRSMKTAMNEYNAIGNYKQATKDDHRITKLGRFLRKSNLDELPQFFNVLKGEMSIVGPRPHPTPLNIESKNKIENYMMRHMVRPGITGWAQVNGFRGETKTLDLMQKRVDYDLWYIENWTFWLDCQIILQTVVNMIKGDKNAY